MLAGERGAKLQAAGEAKRPEKAGPGGTGMGRGSQGPVQGRRCLGQSRDGGVSGAAAPCGRPVLFLVHCLLRTLSVHSTHEQSFSFPFPTVQVTHARGGNLENMQRSKQKDKMTVSLALTPHLAGDSVP